MDVSLEVRELEAVSAKDEQGTVDLRSFSLSLNGITVHLCTVGASVSSILLPNYASSPATASDVDDIVLGYKSPADMLESGNTPYFGVIVGRVANRIAKGVLETDNGQSYQLAINNGPNHLHGGIRGFNRCIWDAEIVAVPAIDALPETKGIQFSLTSKDGDQNYPGTVLVTATYTLVSTPDSRGAGLRLVMDAKLLDDKVTPIAMAQHSYFNLASHNDPNGSLHHKLTLPSEYYTPVDQNLIPTREVRSLAQDPSMDWRLGKLVKDALIEYGIEKAGLTDEESKRNVSLARCAPDTAKTGNNSSTPGEPYGFDHNYVVKRTNNGTLNLAGVVEHEETMRRMTVWTDQPGVQLYTGNFLDGVALDSSYCKDSASYLQWQSICLETQTYPDSILVSEQEFPEFAKGKCHILRPGGPNYHHTVEYRFEPMS